MEFESNYEITRTAQFILSHNFTRVALQFPDELLKDSVKVVSALRRKLVSGELDDARCETSNNGKDIGLFVLADTTYGSCCVDEVGASHASADCVIHYGHTCFSPTSKLPAYFVFGKALINVSECVQSISNHALKNKKSILVLFGLEYAHAVQSIKEELIERISSSYESEPRTDIVFADAKCAVMNPLVNYKISDGHEEGAFSGCSGNEGCCAEAGSSYSAGGLVWDLPEGQTVEDYLLCWIGSDNAAFANVVLTFNRCDIVRYDAKDNHLLIDLSQTKRVLMRRYYLVEKAKDANIIGLLVGTLGVAGYLRIINQMKELITKAGKKAYTLVMGKPNPAKLANFPECDVFIYVSCAQTALLDSKEYLAPVITPFEALVAFSRGREWTGEYVLEFGQLINSTTGEVTEHPEEPRFSFLRGGYVEDSSPKENGEDHEEASLALVNATEKALRVRDNDATNILVRGNAKSGAEFFANRSYQGLDMHSNISSPEPYLIGRTGKASGYEGEISKQSK